MILIFSAPSGAGKSTLINFLLTQRRDLEFSISATTRDPRGVEQHGKEYYFITNPEFERLIRDDQLVEWQQVYSGTYYGTLKSEIERIESAGHHVVFDVDVEGGINLKRIFGDKYENYKDLCSDVEGREIDRADRLAYYVETHNLPATMYQDYGWPARQLPK